MMIDIAKLIREPSFIEHCPVCDSKLEPEGDNTLKCPAHLRIFVLCAGCCRLAIAGSPDQKHCDLCYRIIQLEAKAEQAYAAGRAAGLGEAIATIEHIKSSWQDSQERGRAIGVVVYEGALVVAANEILKAVEALAGGGKVGKS